MTPVHQERRRRLMAAMNDAGCDAVLVYGNAWQCDYLRYVTDLETQENEIDEHQVILEQLRSERRDLQERIDELIVTLASDE